MSEREETFEEASGPVPEDAMTAAELAPAFANDIARAAEETLAEAPSEAGRLSRRVAGMELGGLLMVAAALVAAIVSATVLADHFSSPDAWTSQIASLNARAETATGLVTVATALSAGISLIPGDFGAPIAEKLVEPSVDLGVVLAAIYLEKCLLTIFSLAAFRLLVPLSCALAVAAVVASGRLRWDQNAGMQALLRSFALRLAVFAVAGFLVVPASVMVPDVVQATYRADVETVTAAVASAPEESPIEEPKAEEAAPEPEASEQTQEDRNVLDSFLGWVSDRAADASSVASDVVDAAGNAVQTVTDGAKSFIESAKNVLNRMIEAFAVMVATCCVIPIVTLLFFVWLANTVLGLGISMPDARGLRRPGQPVAAKALRRKGSAAGEGELAARWVAGVTCELGVGAAWPRGCAAPSGSARGQRGFGGGARVRRARCCAHRPLSPTAKMRSCLCVIACWLKMTCACACWTHGCVRNSVAGERRGRNSARPGLMCQSCDAFLAFPPFPV